MDNEQHWIWTSDWTDSDKHLPRLVNFRRVLELENIVNSVIKITADSRYKLFVNGSLVEVGPCKGDQQVWYFDKIDITKFLKPGKNVLAVSVLRYPQEQSLGNYSVFRTEYPGLYAECQITTKDSPQTVHTQTLVTDEQWKCAVNREFNIVSESDDFAPLKIYEQDSGDPALKGWKTTNFDDQAWPSALPYAPHAISRQISPGNLLPRPIPFLYRTAHNFEKVVQVKSGHNTSTSWQQLLTAEKPVTVAPHSKAVVEISAGEETTGYLYLNLLQGKSSHVRLLQSEAYVQDEMTSTNGMPIPVKKDRCDNVKGHLDGFTDNYTVAGYGDAERPEQFSPFWFRTFRFIRLEITTKDDPLTITKFNYEKTGYPINVTTAVQTSDKSLAAIWDISERTLKRCMHETYEDCPFYEQIQYAMDSRAQILYTYATSGDDRLARKCMDDLKRSQRYDGLLNCSAPNYTSNVIPTFSIYYILMVQDHMMYFGDQELVKKHLPTIVRILNFFDQHLTAEGYVDKIGGLNIVDRFWSFTDWTPEWNATSGVPAATLHGPITSESLVYLMGLQAAYKLAQYLDSADLANALLNRITALKHAITSHCIGKNGMVQDGPGVENYSQQNQVFGILTGVLNTSAGHRILRQTIEEKADYAQCSVAMSFYLYRALQKVHLYEYTNYFWNIWRRMVKNNCSTCIEAEAGDRSECHGWGAVILYELPAVTLGVTPTKPGYQEFTIDPEVGYLDWARGHVTTPLGRVDVAWKKEQNHIAIQAKVPKAMTLKLPKNQHFTYSIAYV